MSLNTRLPPEETTAYVLQLNQHKDEALNNNQPGVYPLHPIHPSSARRSTRRRTRVRPPNTKATPSYHSLTSSPPRPRQAKDYNQDATAAAAQAPAVTTIYMQASVGNTVTYKPFTVTQTFAKVPDQWPTPASGVIGYGTLTKRDEKEKREAEPTGGAGIAGRRIPFP